MIYWATNGPADKTGAKILMTDKPKSSIITESQRRDKEKLKKTRKFSASSQRWLQRQLDDPYVAEAKAQGYRARAAFKLLQLDEKYKLLRAGQRIVDLGCAPGGWLQVCVEKTGVLRGKPALVVGIDILPVEPVPGATIIQADFTTDEALAQLMQAIGGEEQHDLDVVLSDIAAGTTGHARTDAIRIAALAELALDFAIRTLKPNGAFVCKLFQGGADKELNDLLKKHFKVVRNAKPPASRADSRESYVVATGFKGGE